METENLNLIISRLRDTDVEIQKMALNALHDEIRANTGTISAKQQELFDILGSLKECIPLIKGEERKHLYDLISVLSVGIDLESGRNVLKYRIHGNITDFECWGHQYVKHLIIAINNVVYNQTEFEEFKILIEPIVSFLFKHNSEVEAIDFLLEIGDIPQLRPVDNEAGESNCKISSKLSLILNFLDDDNYDRVLLYLDEMSRFFNLENIILESSRKKPTQYLIHLIKYSMFEDAINFVKSIEDSRLKTQCLYILSKCNIYYQGSSEENKILSNFHISEFYSQTIDNLEIMKCKKMDYVLKGLNKEKIEVAAICNGLIHFGYSRDPLFLRHPEDYNLKPEYMALLRTGESNPTVCASAGLINAFNPSKASEMFKTGIYEENDLGSILAFALSSFKTFDPGFEPLVLLEPFLSSSDPEEVIMALHTISIVYSGQYNSHLAPLTEKLSSLLTHDNQHVISMAIYTFGSIHCGSGNLELFEMCSNIFSEVGPGNSVLDFLPYLGLALFFYGRGDLEGSEALIKQNLYIQCLSIGMMNIGTGCPRATETILTESLAGEGDSKLESIGLISLTLIAIGDPVCTELVERIITSAQLLNTPNVLNTIPLCMALLYSSTGKHQAIDYLEKSLNSRTCNVNSVVALGIVGAGTNSSRILGILNSNFNALYKDLKGSSALIFAQGLLNMGKGMVTLNPVAYHGQVIIKKSVVGLLSTIMLFVDENQDVFKNHSFALLSIIQGANPKYCTGFSGEIKVGKPVDTVGLTGKPNTISGTVVHQMPVVLGTNERAEVTDEVLTDYIEDILVQK